MNNIDSESVEAFDASPINSAAVSKTASQKAAALKARLAKILSASGVRADTGDDAPSHFTFGVDALDRALRGNAAADGLPLAALHEIHSAAKGDISSAVAMALLLAERAAEAGSGDAKKRPILWITESGEARRQGRLYPPGLAQMGIDPARVIHVDAPDSIAVLRAAADGVRSSAMAAVILELAGKKPKGLDMTATRRLSLSAQQSGVLTLLIRSGTVQGDPLPTAAFSRWQVAAAPSAVLPGNAPGHPAFDLSLLRHRSGLYGLSARLEWNRDLRQFRDIGDEQSGGRAQHQNAPDAGDLSAVSAFRTDHSRTRAA